MTKFTKDEEILEKIRQGNQSLIKQLFDQFEVGFVGHLKKTFTCDRQKALNIYPEAFSILYYNIKKGKLTLPLRSTLQTYLSAIGKNVFHKRYLDKYHMITSELDPQVEKEIGEIVEDAIEKKDRARELKRLLRILGEPCHHLLDLFYYQELKFADIAQELNENEGRLRKRKFDCLKKLHQLISKEGIEL